MKKITDYDYEELIRKEEAFNSKMTNAICAFGFSAATSAIIGLCFGLVDTPAYVPFYIGGTIVGTPISYILLSKLKKKMDRKFKKDMLGAGNLITMLSEFHNQDRIINEKTSLFLQEIDLNFNNNGIELAEGEVFHLNQFLFLINVNYFDSINENVPTLTRERLIDHIIKQAVIYYKDTGKNTFDEEDGKAILDRCLLVTPELKEKIYKEFKDSKTRLGKMIEYAIERKDISHEIDMNIAMGSPSILDPYSSLAAEARSSKNVNFDITSMEDYKTLIEAVCDSDYLKQFGNPHELEWDMDFLYRIMNLVAVNYRQELIDLDPEYTNFRLVGDYIFQSLTYALVNNRKEVGQRELLGAFKNYHYIPFSIQDKALTKLFEEDGLDYSLHPYRDRRDPALDKRPKIIKLGEYKFNKKDENETTE